MKLIGTKQILQQHKRVALTLLILSVSYLATQFLAPFSSLILLRSQDKRDARQTSSSSDPVDSTIRTPTSSKRPDSDESEASVGTSSINQTRHHTISVRVGKNDTLYRRDDNLVDIVVQDLMRTANVSDIGRRKGKTCSDEEVIGNSCDSTGCQQLQLPTDLRTRVKQILMANDLRVDTAHKSALAAMGDKVPGTYDLILVSAVSWSHFGEAQALLLDLHTHLFPLLSNFTLVMYDIGLSEEQRLFLVKVCKCHLIQFPFHDFPDIVGIRKCYTWKPLIVHAHISRASLVFWVDSSVRFKNSPKISQNLARARDRGVQVMPITSKLAPTTLPSMFHYFGDEACIYQRENSIIGSAILVHNQLFVREAILEPWTACALTHGCMCPKNVDVHEVRISCHHPAGRYTYGVCHRFDQSALSLILIKIYQEKLDYILAPDFVSIRRGDRRDYPVES